MLDFDILCLVITIWLGDPCQIGSDTTQVKSALRKFIIATPSTFSMHPQLPRELVSTIISQVTDNSTLLSLCLAAKATYREGSAQLYHSIDETGLQYGALRRQIKLLETLASNPYLSSLVHSYSIWSIAPRVAPEHIPDFQARAGRPTEWEHPEERFWHLLPLALNLMVNLKQLRFRERTGQPSADWLFANVTFQLKRLEWGSQREGAGMANFLVRQHHLEHLCILDGLLCPLAPSACVSVRSLKGDLTTLKRFLPGRPAITHLEWVLGHTENPAGLVRSPTLLPELGRITHLIIGGNSMRQNLAQYLVGCFHSLVALHLLSLKKVSEQIEPLDT